MHPAVRRAVPGACPRCGMDLVPMPLERWDEARVVLSTSPSPPAPGRPFVLIVRLTAADGTPIGALTDVHERPLHLFVVDEQLEALQHVHPERADDGRYRVPLTLPSAGRYQLFFDFLPEGGFPQLVSRPLFTRGYAAPPRVATLGPPQLVNDADGLRLALEPLGPTSAGLVSRFRLRVEERGEAAAGLEPFLGAGLHVVAIDALRAEAVHSHGDLPTTAGPIPFEVRLPRPGMYRLFAQIQRRGEVITARFTLRADEPGALPQEAGETKAVADAPSPSTTSRLPVGSTSGASSR